MSQFIGLNNQFYKEIEEEIDAIRQTLCSGALSSFEEYKRLTGKLAGLAYALNRHKELISLMKEADDK
jgi:hypothetical protein